jgi:hypothetical protein
MVDLHDIVMPHRSHGPSLAKESLAAEINVQGGTLGLSGGFTWDNTETIAVSGSGANQGGFRDEEV